MKIAEVPNVHPDPKRHFAIAGAQAKHLLEKFGKENFVAVFHTHLHPLHANPSAHDYRQLSVLRNTWPWLMGIVYNVPRGQILEYSSIGPLRKLLLPERK